MADLEQFQRSSCDCQLCAAGCKTKPGALIPGDLERIMEYCEDESADFVMQYFQASEGATLLATVDGKYLPVSIPSIVPAQTATGRCVFLSDDDLCLIHEVSPFGCSHFRICNDTDHQAEAKLQYMVKQQLRAHVDRALYSQVWLTLYKTHRRARPMEERKAAYVKLTTKIQAQDHNNRPGTPE